MRKHFILTGLLSMCTITVGLAGPAKDGVALYNAKRYTEARVVFQQALEKNANDPNTLYYYANTMQALGDNAASRKIYQRIVNQFADSAAAVYARQALGLPPVNSVQSSAQTIKTPAIKSAESEQTIKIGGNETLPIYPGSTLRLHNSPSATYPFEDWSYVLPCTADEAMSYYQTLFAKYGWKSESRKETGKDYNHKGCNGQVESVNLKRLGMKPQLEVFTLKFSSNESWLGVHLNLTAGN